MIILGIDPGVTGAIAVLTSTKRLDVYDLPFMIDSNKSKRRLHISGLCQLLREIKGGKNGYEGIVAYLEQAQAMPKQGVSSTFAYGRTNGIIEGALGALEVRTIRVIPAVWKRRLGLLGGQVKGASIHRAKELYPDAPLSLAKHHNRAEAILIGHYGCLMEGSFK